MRRPGDTVARGEPAQLGLFDNFPTTITPASQPPIVDDGAASPSWTAMHWPNYAGGYAEPVRESPFVLWAEAHTDVPFKARATLIELARRVDREGTVRTCLKSIAAECDGIARNTLKRRLQLLLDAGLVMVRPWAEIEQSLGYWFRLIVDEDARAAALADGFSSERLARR